MAKGKYQEWLTTDGLLKLAAWARDGLTNEQIAHNMGVSLTTFKEYKSTYPTISTALKKGKEVVDIEVENALLNKALGGTYTDQVAFKVKHTVYSEETGRKIQEYEEVVVVDVKKGYPPEAVAIFYWLNNRKPEAWRNNRQHVDQNAISDLEKIVAVIRGEAKDDL